MSDSTPAVLPEGNADPLTGLLPAATTVTCHTGQKATKLADLSSVELDSYIKDRADECQRYVDGFARSVSELYLALFEMESRYTKQRGARTDLKELSAQTWTEYVENSGANYDSYRKWKSRMNAATKQLGTVIAPDTAKVSHKDSAVTQAAQLLSDAKAKLGRSAEDGSEEAKAILADYEQRHADAIAAAEKDKETAKPSPSPETRVNRRLATIVNVAEKYIRVMERVVNTATITDRQKKDLDKASEAWAEVLRDARELSWAVKVIEKQGEKEEAA